MKENVIICGDCLQVMRDMPDNSVDLVLTDPPYGMNKKWLGGTWGGTIPEWDKQRASSAQIKELIRVSDNQIIWGGHYFSDFLYPSMGWLVWDKTPRGLTMSDCELAWSSFNNANRIFTTNICSVDQDGRVHPTQKPLNLIEWCIGYADRHGSANFIFDPFCGSGTTCVAAKRLGRSYIGIDISEEYCNIARKRLEAEEKGITVKELEKGQGSLFK